MDDGLLIVARWERCYRNFDPLIEPHTKLNEQVYESSKERQNGMQYRRKRNTNKFYFERKKERKKERDRKRQRETERERQRETE